LLHSEKQLPSVRFKNIRKCKVGFNTSVFWNLSTTKRIHVAS